MIVKNNSPETIKCAQRQSQEFLKTETETTFLNLLKNAEESQSSSTQSAHDSAHFSQPQSDPFDAEDADTHLDKDTEKSSEFSASSGVKLSPKTYSKKESDTVKDPLLFLKLPDVTDIQKLSEWLSVLAQKMIEITVKIEKKSPLDTTRYVFELGHSDDLPLDMAVKKVNGLLAITLFSKGELKEILLTHLPELMQYLKNKGVELGSLQIEQLRDMPSGQGDGRQQQSHTENEAENFIEEFEEDII